MPESVEPIRRPQLGFPWNDWHPTIYTASKECLHRFRNIFVLENIKVTGQAASANEESTATEKQNWRNWLRRKVCVYGKCI